MAQKLADIINTAGDSVPGRFGPDQSGVIHAQAWASGPSTGGITLTFVLGAGATARYGELGNLDRVFVAHGRTLAGVPVGSGQGFQWTAGSGTTILFANGDNNTKYHVTLDFTQTLLDKNGAAVPMSDCRKMYMVFAPRFENVEQDLQDGCFLAAGVGASDAMWTVDDTSKLTGGRYFIGAPNLEERIPAAARSADVMVEKPFKFRMLPSALHDGADASYPSFRNKLVDRCRSVLDDKRSPASLRSDGGLRHPERMIGIVGLRKRQNGEALEKMERQINQLEQQLGPFAEHLHLPGCPLTRSGANIR